MTMSVDDRWLGDPDPSGAGAGRGGRRRPAPARRAPLRPASSARRPAGPAQDHFPGLAGARYEDQRSDRDAGGYDAAGDYDEAQPDGDDGAAGDLGGFDGYDDLGGSGDEAGGYPADDEEAARYRELAGFDELPERSINDDDDPGDEGDGFRYDDGYAGVAGGPADAWPRRIRPDGRRAGGRRAGGRRAGGRGTDGRRAGGRRAGRRRAGRR